MFNRSTTLRGSFIVITGHFGETPRPIHCLRAPERHRAALTEEAQRQQQKPSDNRSHNQAARNWH